MKIPPRIEELLRTDPRLQGAVLQTLSGFEPWLKDNKVVFFPEYTDHGPDHVESVMRGAEALIREEAWPYLTAQDAATILLSVLLHDCAMHLSEDGFLALVSPDSRWAPRGRVFLDRMRAAPWPQLWQEFRREAARFDQDKLRSLFGDTEPAPMPDPDGKGWARRDHLLIGEFMRRHHARLAHEIALLGIPGPGTERLKFAPMDDDWLPDLAGFVARSHNLDLRLSADHMPPEGRRNFRGVHAPFAMAVLRIADYLEIEAPRAPGELLRVRSLTSPISRAEWRKHDAVKHIRPSEEDPEALFVDAEPTDVRTFLGLRRLFQGIQAELDACWAVLGEVYGADPRLRALGLSVRRIRSTLDDVAAFGKGVDYLPVDARFRVSGGEVLKLLVGPLYGQNPAFGVRELMQNAVDACREREDYEQQNPDKRLDLPELEADVVVLLEENEDGTGWLTVEDRGIGMTPEVAQRYFLTAGASFRNSETWHRRHDDGGGTPRVLRTGRFGVGALAAFLIGDQIKVTTRHAEEDRGVEFTCRLDESELELRWCERKVGTTVRVQILDASVLEQLVLGRDLGQAWDWYWLDQPSLVRNVLLRKEHMLPGRAYEPTGGQVPMTSRWIPSSGARLPFYWVRAHHPDFDDIQYTWKQGDFCTFIHNGFVLRNPPFGRGALHGAQSRLIWPPDESGISTQIKRPLLSVFDRVGKMPINLVRTGLTTEVAPIDEVVLRSICCDILGALLVRLPTTPSHLVASLVHERRRGQLERPFLHDSIEPVTGGWSWLHWIHAGVGLTDEAMMNGLSAQPICFAPIIPSVERSPAMSWFWKVLRTSVLEPQGLDIGMWEEPHVRMAKWVAMVNDPQADVNDHFWDGPKIFGPFSLLTPRSTMLIVCRALWEPWRAHDPRPDTTQHAPVGDHWILEWTGEDKRHLLDLEHLSTIVPEGMENPIGIWFDCEGPKEEVPVSPLAQAWKDIIRHPVIPWDKAERRALLAHAYKELADEVDRWEKITLREQQEQEQEQEQEGED